MEVIRMITKVVYYTINEDTGKKYKVEIDPNEFHYIINHIQDYNSLFDFLDILNKWEEIKDEVRKEM